MYSNYTHHHLVGKQRGSVMLIALVVLGAVTLSTVYLSLVLLAEIRSTRYADNSIVSHYVAESASERALWLLRKAKEESDPTIFTANQGAKRLCAAEDGGDYYGCTNHCYDDPNVYCTTATASTDCGPGVSCVLASSGGDTERLYEYSTLSTSADDFTLYDMPRNSPYFADIYDPAESYATVDTGINRLDVDWYVSACEVADSSAKLEITYTPVITGGSGFTLGEPTTIIDICSCNSGMVESNNTFKCDPLADASVIVTGSTLSPSNYYRISFRSLDVPVHTLVMRARHTNNVSATVPIPSHVQVRAVGTYRESQSVVSLRTLWKDTLSGIFNYVIFSEDSLIKDTKGNESSPYDSLCGFCTNSDPDTLLYRCSTNTDCSAGEECIHANTDSDVMDEADTKNYCSETSATEIYTDGVSINQTDAGTCNARCNGLTFCGDGTLQSPNGIGLCDTSGVLCTDAGDCGGGSCVKDEACDAGPLNSDRIPLRCREDCTKPRCGDEVVDQGIYYDPVTGDPDGPERQEECDDGTDCTDGTCNGADRQCTPDTCQLTYCGDGVTQAPNGLGVNEVCDIHIANCNATCTAIDTP